MAGTEGLYGLLDFVLHLWAVRLTRLKAGATEMGKVLQFGIEVHLADQVPDDHMLHVVAWRFGGRHVQLPECPFVTTQEALQHAVVDEFIIQPHRSKGR